MLPSALGPVVVEARGEPEWATGVRVVEEAGGLWLDWHGGHHHRNRVVGRPAVVGETLRVPTAELGVVVLRAVGPDDYWLVFPANVSAWEAYRRGLR